MYDTNNSKNLEVDYGRVKITYMRKSDNVYQARDTDNVKSNIFYLDTIRESLPSLKSDITVLYERVNEYCKPIVICTDNKNIYTAMDIAKYNGDLKARNLFSSVSHKQLPFGIINNDIDTRPTIGIEYEGIYHSIVDMVLSTNHEVSVINTLDMSKLLWTDYRVIIKSLQNADKYVYNGYNYMPCVLRNVKLGDIVIDEFRFLLTDSLVVDSCIGFDIIRTYGIKISDYTRSNRIYRFPEITRGMNITELNI